MDARWARTWFAATAAVVLAGVIIQLFVTANSSTAFGGSPLNRALNIFAYFTVDSNVLVGGTCLLLAINSNRTSTVFRVARLMGLMGITITFLVFHVVLSRLLDLESWAQAANQLLHTVSPILAIAGWALFGPRGLTSTRVVTLTALFPALYMAFTVIRGPLCSDFYPYPFADVHALGYAKVIVNGVWIALLFIALAAAATALDNVLPGYRPTNATPAAGTEPTN